MVPSPQHQVYYLVMATEYDLQALGTDFTRLLRPVMVPARDLLLAFRPQFLENHDSSESDDYLIILVPTS